MGLDSWFDVENFEADDPTGGSNVGKIYLTSRFVILLFRCERHGGSPAFESKAISSLLPRINSYFTMSTITSVGYGGRTMHQPVARPFSASTLGDLSLVLGSHCRE